MQIAQELWTAAEGWRRTGSLAGEADLVLVFGARPRLDHTAFAQLRQRHPRACLFGCSTAGEILDTRLLDDTLVATAVRFRSSSVALASVPLSAGSDTHAAGAALGARLPAAGLRHVLVLSEGLGVNGSALVAGLKSALPAGVALTGGLAGDACAFGSTLVLADAAPAPGIAAALGLYGNALHVGYGSVGGWRPFGPERLITRAEGNVLYELDGLPALALYQRYLGEEASAGLPATGLRFPFSLTTSAGAGLVRSVLAVDHASGAMTCAGEMPEGATLRLMRTSYEGLIDGAETAARDGLVGLAGHSAELALMVSCVGRRLVLRQRTEEELEAARAVLGPGAAMTGFYSYGEICPFRPTSRCELHNQTMTVTTFTETESP